MTIVGEMCKEDLLVDEGEGIQQGYTTSMEIAELSMGDIQKIKELNISIFPIRYSDEFYETLFSQGVFTYSVGYEEMRGIVSFRVAKGESVGRTSPSMNCLYKENRCQKCADREEEDSLTYIIILGLLAEARGKGLGRRMMEFIEDESVKRGVGHIALHVIVSNEGAIRFYEKMGFSCVKCVKNYYHNVTPRDAFLLRKCLHGSGKDGL